MDDRVDPQSPSAFPAEPSAPAAARPALEETARLTLARRYLDPAHDLVPGNRCELLRDGVEAFPAMLEAIAAARTSIRLETYMLIDDSVGELFGRALMDAAQRGVRVRVLYDALGSLATRRAYFRKLRAGGVDVRAFKPFSLSRGLDWHLRRDHRKLLVVDGQVAFVGGVNIAAKWAPKNWAYSRASKREGDGWRDDVLRVEGPAVAKLERRFRASWRMIWRERLRTWRKLTDLSEPRRRGDVSLVVLSSRRAIHKAYLHAIQRARRSVFIAAAYFVPERRLLSALIEAAQRGVKVVLITAGKSDHMWITHATRAYYERLMRWGVRIFEWNKAVLHAKTAVVDGAWGTIGSFNLERMSLLFNHEVNVLFADERVGRQVEESFLLDCDQCVHIDPAAWAKRPWWQKLRERVAYWFRRIL